MAHTILLLQANSKPDGRTYSDYESVNECMEGVCKIYEEHLKANNPNLPSITYDISQLFDFIDQVSELNVTVRPLNSCIPAGRSLVPGIPEVHQFLRSIQQRLDKGEDLHPPQTAGRERTLIECPETLCHFMCFVSTN